VKLTLCDARAYVVIGYNTPLLMRSAITATTITIAAAAATTTTTTTPCQNAGRLSVFVCCSISIPEHRVLRFRTRAITGIVKNFIRIIDFEVRKQHSGYGNGSVYKILHFAIPF